jgi:hypothetical protein
VRSMIGDTITSKSSFSMKGFNLDIVPGSFVD